MIIALEELRRFLRPPPPPHESSTRQPKRERGEIVAEYIHRLLNENPTICKEQLPFGRSNICSTSKLEG